MAPVLSARRAGEHPLEVDEDRAGQVPRVVGRAAGQARQVAADVGEHDLARVRLPPGARDDGTDHVRGR